MPATCTKDSISSNFGCYTREIFPDQDALEVFMWVYVLSAMGGTDFSGTMSSTLLTNANTMTCGMTKADLQKAKMYILDQWGASLFTPAQIKDAIKCLTNATKHQKQQAIVYLLCQISNVAT